VRAHEQRRGAVGDADAEGGLETAAGDVDEPGLDPTGRRFGAAKELADEGHRRAVVNFPREPWHRVRRTARPAFQETLRVRILSAFEHELEPIAGVPALLDALAVDRCVASSSHPERIRRSLELVGLLERMAPHLFSASMVSAGKPAPDLFLLAAARMAAEPARCLVVEDSEVGIRAAKAAGMTVFGFTGASHVRPKTHAPRLRAAGADAILAEMAALVGLIGRFS
jgi:HAD superfamily hydrolase (TIGR01509 family)